ncbi:MAG: glycosyltransferase family 4 protein [gamma proteobacterium symbiont of Taylorina sp.]|nr:glycosyltransferase family 4 protein [gamma proteobacterium symbiont of Taylorina sp.]
MNKFNVWLPAIKAGSGADVYTIRLRDALRQKGFNANITWFNHFSELFPFSHKGKVPSNTHIIIANSWNSFVFKHPSIPLITIAHHCVFDKDFEKYKTIPQKIYHNNVIYYYEKWSLEKSDAVIAVSQYTADSYNNIFSIKDVNIIHNWIDSSQFKPNNYKKNNKKFRLLFIGNWSKRKGSDLLPAIMEQLGNHYELICTSGMRERKSHKSLHSNINIIGHLPAQQSLIELYQSADLLLFPSRLEGFGYSPLEAHACGIPVVASDSSAIPEVVHDGKTGLLCPVDNIDSFVKAIKFLKNNLEVHHNMSLTARKRAVELFSEEIIISKYIKLLKSII